MSQPLNMSEYWVPLKAVLNRSANTEDVISKFG